MPIRRKMEKANLTRGMTMKLGNNFSIILTFLSIILKGNLFEKSNALSTLNAMECYNIHWGDCMNTKKC